MIIIQLINYTSGYRCNYYIRWYTLSELLMYQSLVPISVDCETPKQHLIFHKVQLESTFMILPKVSSVVGLGTTAGAMIFNTAK